MLRNVRFPPRGDLRRTIHTRPRESAAGQVTGGAPYPVRRS